MWSSESNEDAYRQEVTQEMARDDKLFVKIFAFNIRSNWTIESIRSSKRWFQLAAITWRSFQKNKDLNMWSPSTPLLQSEWRTDAVMWRITIWTWCSDYVIWSTNSVCISSSNTNRAKLRSNRKRIVINSIWLLSIWAIHIWKNCQCVKRS